MHQRSESTPAVPAIVTLLDAHASAIGLKPEEA